MRFWSLGPSGVLACCMMANVGYASVPDDPVQQDAAGDDQADQEDERHHQNILVVGARRSFAQTQTTTATRTDTSVMDVPQSIQIVTRAVIDSQNALRLTDALQNVSSVQLGSSSGNRGETYQIRGFSSPRYAIDGVILNRVADRPETFLDLANVKSIEVLKGPASVLYGQGDAGGLINITTLRPSQTLSADASFQYGSFDFQRGQASVTGRLNHSGTLTARLTGAIQSQEGFRFQKGAIRSTRHFGALAVNWAPDDKTSIDLDADFTEQRQPFDRGLVISSDNRVHLPVTRYLAEPWSVTGATKKRVSINIRRRMTSWLNWVANLRYTGSRITDSYAIDFRSLADDDRMLGRRATNRLEDLDSFDARTEGIATFNTFSLKHTVLAGFNYSNARIHSSSSRGNISSVDIFDPVYTRLPVDRLAPRSNTVRVSNLYAGYAQDQITLFRWFKLLGSVRYDGLAENTNDKMEGNRTRQAEGALTGRAGFVYEPLRQLSLYFGYAESFQPQTAQRSDQSYLDPERGQQYEVGVKYNPLQDRFVATASLFQITRQNVAASDPNDPDYSIQTGEQRIRGAEFDLSGNLTRNWRMIGNVSYLDGQISKDTTYGIGNRLTNVPRWSGRLWTSYDFTGRLQNLTWGGGVTLVGRRAGDLDNSFDVKGYASFDTTLSYAFFHKRLEASLTGRNLANHSYIESSVSRTEIYPGSPRSFLFTLRAHY
ncbi:TonB-dependent siderophore receptor [Gluconobacter thailandicus]|nr:TonB-dependent receptor [Gluconobacter thailandicus]